MSYGTLPPEIVTLAEGQIERLESGGSPLPLEG
jgi:hypothetical protein